MAVAHFSEKASPMQTVERIFKTKNKKYNFNPNIYSFSFPTFYYFVGICNICYFAATLLFFLAELAEEHTVWTMRLLKFMLYTLIGVMTYIRFVI